MSYEMVLCTLRACATLFHSLLFSRIACRDRENTAMSFELGKYEVSIEKK